MLANHLKIWKINKCTSVVATTFVELLVKISNYYLKMALNMVSIT